MELVSQESSPLRTGLNSPANGSVTPNGTTSVTIVGTDNGGAGPSLTTYTISASQAGTVHFNWSYGTNDGPEYDQFIFLKNGVVTVITDDNGGSSQNGSQSILVNKNDVFGFGIDATDSCCGEGFVTIDNFLFLLFGPSATDTLASMQRNAVALRNFFAIQASYNNPGLSYDCAVFDTNGICVSGTARNTSVSSSGLDGTSGVLTAAYRVNQNFRVGGFIEQLTSSINDGGIHLDNNNPDFGVFGVWQENSDGVGLKFRAAYRYGQQNLKITREAIGSAEAGTGESDLTSQGLQFTLSKGFSIRDRFILSPYVGMRYLNIERDGYTEDTSPSVTTPLTYSSLRQETTSLLLGANLSARISSKLIGTGSLGIEQDTSRKLGDYSAKGIIGLDSIDFASDTNRTRGVASLGLAYYVKSAHVIGGQLTYREEAYGSTSTTTAMVSYTAGF